MGLNPEDDGLLNSMPEFVEANLDATPPYYRLSILLDNQYIMSIFSQIGIHDEEVEEWLADRAEIDRSYDHKTDGVVPFLMLKQIYLECGIDLEEIPAGKGLDREKIVISQNKAKEIVDKVEAKHPEYERFNVSKAVAYLGPMVDKDPTKEVVLKDGYIIDKS